MLCRDKSWNQLYVCLVCIPCSCISAFADMLSLVITHSGEGTLSPECDPIKHTIAYSSGIDPVSAIQAESTSAVWQKSQSR